MKGKSILLPVILLMLIFKAAAYAYEYSSEYWSANEAYGKALENDNYSDIIKYGNKTLDAIADMPEGKEKRDIIVSRTDEIGKAYAALKDYENSAETFKSLYDYVIRFGNEYYDQLRSSKAHYEQYSSVLELYTDGGTAPYHNAVNEKKNGVLVGICSTGEARKKLSNEAILLAYQEFGQTLLAHNKGVMNEASKKGYAVEFALNCPEEAKDIKNTEKMASYLKEISDLFTEYKKVPIYLRFGAEFDIWEDHASAQDYVRAFRYVSDYFKSRNPNVAMVWSPNQTSKWDKTVNLDDYYPGDKYVDWVGVSSYAKKYFFGDKDKEINEIAFKFGINSDPVIAVKDIVEKYGSKKPIMISETGCGHTVMPGGEDVSDFAVRRLKEYYSYLPMVYPQIKLISYFDNYVDGEPYDYRLPNNSAMLKEYEKLTKGERFITDKYSNETDFCYRKVEDNISVGNTFLASCYAHRYNTDVNKVTYFIDDKYAGISTDVPFATYINAEGYSGRHKLKAVASFSDGKTMTSEKAINISAARDISVEISGSRIYFDQDPIIYNDRTMVPMRKIFEELGASVDWNGDTKTVTGKRGDRTVKVSVGVRKMYINNKEIILDTAPLIISDRTLVPVRAVAEGLGSEVDWDGRQYLVSITPKVFKWSDWDFDLPAGIDDDLYYIEEKTEYRYRTRDKKEFSLDYFAKAGNFVREEVSYGEWSGWQREYIEQTENREVRTRTGSDPVQYHYAHYCTGYTEDADNRWKSSSRRWLDICDYHDLGWYDYQLPSAPDGNGGYVIYNDDGSMYRCSNTCYRFYPVETTGGEYTEYSRRNVYHKYIYWDLTDWTSWTDWSESLPPNSVRYEYNLNGGFKAEIDERTMYRYKEK